MSKVTVIGAGSLCSALKRILVDNYYQELF